jgi:hypothetical protein
MLSTVLQSLFRDEKPRIGEKLAIQYLGRHPEKGYHRYILALNRPDQIKEFQRLAGLNGHQPQPPAARAPEPVADYAAETPSRIRPRVVDGETQRRRRDRGRATTSERAAALAVVRTQSLARNAGTAVVNRGPADDDPNDPFLE